MTTMRALVVGAGIAGLTVALGLRRLGWEPLVVELATGLRGEGYMVDFFGPGYDAAERLGLLPQLAGIHRPIPQLVFLDQEGRRRLSLAYPEVRRRLFAGRHYNFLRGDLETLLLEQVVDDVPVRFGTTVEAVAQDAHGVHVDLSDGTSETVELLVGADGVHSRVRALVFGPSERFRVDLGHVTAAWTLDRPPRGSMSGAFTTLNAPGRMVAVYPTGNGRTATFFTHRSRDTAGELRLGPQSVLATTYAGLGWIVPELLASLPTDGSCYFDEVVQVRMGRWHQGRVVLVGDAAWCVSLLAGQGASLALAGADLLASALYREPADLPAALSSWEAQLRTPVEQRQAAGRRAAAWFVPADRLHLVVRNLFLRVSTWPVLSRVLRRQLVTGTSL